MTYSPTFRHISLLLTLPLGFFVGSVVSQLKLQGAALARSPLREEGLEPSSEAVQKAALEQKKRSWKVGIAFVSVYLLFLFCLFYGANEYPNAISAMALVFYTLLMGYISRTVLFQLLGSSSTLLSRGNDGTLLPENKTPFSVPTALLSLVAPTLFPCIILYPSFLPAFILLSFATIVSSMQNSPWTQAKDAHVSLRWAFLLYLGVEVFAVLLGLAMGFAIKEGVFAAVGGWIEAMFSNGSSAVAVAEEVKEVVEIEPVLGNLIMQGYFFLQPFIWFMTTGWLISILYRLDVYILKEKTGHPLVGVEEFGREPPTKTFAKGETGQKIALPPLRSAIKRHFQAAVISPPTYFLTGIAVFTFLLALFPFVFARLESDPEGNDDVTFSRREAVEVETTASLFTVLLAPWIMSIAIGLVAYSKGQGKLVWTYREAWGESKITVVRGEGEEEKLLRGEEQVKVDVKTVEVLVV